VYSLGSERPFTTRAATVQVKFGVSCVLPDTERDMVIEFPANDFIASVHYELALLLGELAELTIHERGTLSETPVGASPLATDWLMTHILSQ